VLDEHQADHADGGNDLQRDDEVPEDLHRSC
jgi:hypothetical protein